MYIVKLYIIKSTRSCKRKQASRCHFTGGPNSVYLDDAPTIEKEIFELGVPVLGICYGMQLMSEVLGGKVSRAESQEYGKINLQIKDHSKLFKGIETGSQCWMSHFDYVEKAPEGFSIVASTDSSPVAAMSNQEKNLYGVQFHAEVEHTPFGRQMIKNFLYEVCGCKGDWTTANFVEESVKKN